MKTLKEKIEVMQAALEGKEIEFLTITANNWKKAPDDFAQWNWDLFEFRIKPEPMEFFVDIYNAGSINNESYEIASGASRLRRDDSTYKTIKVREVIE